MSAQYAVMGNPIAHSKSPAIHHHFAQQTGIDMLYTKQLVELNDFTQAVTAFMATNGAGLNITLPFKQEAWALANEKTPRAACAQAANTLKKQANGQLLADNTDGAGLVRDITVNLKTPLQAKRILILGAGGAVRGVLQPLLTEQPAELVIANRTMSKAVALATDFADLGPITACNMADLAGHFDVIINGTSASVDGKMPPLPNRLYSTQSLAYDMFYSQEPTVFMQWSHTQGATLCRDGYGMLVEQAAESFLLWHGVRPNTAELIAQR